MAPQEPPAWAFVVFFAFAFLAAGAFLGFVLGALTVRRGRRPGAPVELEDAEPVHRIRQTGGL